MIFALRSPCAGVASPTLPDFQCGALPDKTADAVLVHFKTNLARTPIFYGAP